MVEKELEQAPKPDPVKLEAERQVRQIKAQRESENAAAGRAAIEKEKALQEAAAAVRQKQEQKTAPAISLPVAERLSPLAPETVFARASPAVVRVVVRDRELKEIGLGSGFFVAADGLLVTNYHVVRGAESATVLRADGSTLFVNGVLEFDEDQDLAVLKVNGTGLPCVEVAPADAPLPVGTRVYAIGNPEGLTNTFSDGIVSGIRKGGEIQTTAAISHGSSGGPLVDAQGRVVGVIRASMVDGQALNLAVPAAAVRAILAKAATGKLAPLASVGGRPLGAKATRELDAAWAAMREKRWSDAIEILTGLRSREPENPFVCYALGILQSQLGNRELAVEAYKAAIRLKPDYADAYNNLGGCYAIMGHYAKAVASLKTAILLKPADPTAYYQLGVVYLGMDNRPDAIRAYQDLRQLDPAMAEKLRRLIYGQDAPPKSKTPPTIKVWPWTTPKKQRF